MGMFDKDKEIGLILQNFVSLGEQFIVWDARIVREDFPTSLGDAVQAALTVSKPASPSDKYEVTTLASAITAKVREAETDDFPAVCMLAEVQSKWGRDALIMRFLKPWGNGQTTTTSPPTTSPPIPTAPAVKDDDDDIPFS